MQIIQKAKHSESLNYILIIKRGEEVFESLLKFFQSENIACATFNGLGATDDIDLAYYNLKTKEYERRVISEELELINLNGNFAFLGDKPVLHIHGIFGKRDLSTLGGHLFKMQISGACEIHITTYPSKIGRAYDEETGLNLLCKLG